MAKYGWHGELPDLKGMFCGYCGEPMIAYYTPGLGLTPHCPIHGGGCPIVADPSCAKKGGPDKDAIIGYGPR